MAKRPAWETVCPKRDDGIHCNCWYDGDACCSCGDRALTNEELIAQGSDPRPESPPQQCGGSK